MNFDEYLIEAAHAMRNDAATWDRDDVIQNLKNGRYGSQSAQVLASCTGLGHRIAWSVPQDAVAPGWEVVGTDSEEAKGLNQDMRLASQLVTAGGSSRIGYGAWIWPVVDGEDWGEPLGDGPHEVSAVHVLDDDEVTVLEVENDPTSQAWGRPIRVNIHPSRDGLTYSAQGVHASRLIYIPGAAKRPGWTSRKRGYDLSILELYRAAILGYQGSSTSVSRLSERLSMAWVRLKNGQAAMAGKDGGTGGVQAKLKLLKESMRSAGLYVLLGEDDAGWSGPSLSGIRDASNILAEAVSAVEGIPLSKLVGQAPGGLTTDDEAGRRNYNSALERWRRRSLDDALLRFYDIALGPDPSRRIKWHPFDTPKASEYATTSEALARRDVLLYQAGLIEAVEVRARLANPDALDPVLMDESEVMDSDLPLMLPALEVEDESDVDEDLEVQDVDEGGEE